MMSINSIEKLLELLVCPLTKTKLEYNEETQEFISAEAGLAYPLKNGVPIMLIDQARRITESIRQKSEN